MIIIVCGGRDYQDWERVISVLDRVHAKRPITVLFEGGATGADAHAAVWAETNLVPRVTFNANWHKLGRSAGPRRNKLMLDMGAEGVVAFPGGRGTKNMVRQAKEAGLTVMEVSHA